MSKKYDVFISYSRADTENVEHIAHRLRDEEGMQVFFDKWELIPGEPWQEALEDALENSNTITIYVGSGGTTPWHNEELQVAINLSVNEGKRAIAVLLPGSSEEFVPRFLKRRTWVDFRSGIKDKETFRRLVAGIKGEVPGREMGDKSEPLLGFLYNVPDLPIHFLERPEYLEIIKASILEKGSGKIGITGTGKIGVQGMGGIGKSVLAAALARDDEIRRAFPDGIVWLTISQSPNIIARQRQLGEAMGERDLQIDDVQHGKTLLSIILSDLKIMVILDDIWELNHAESLSFLGENSCILITTRNSEIIHGINAQLHCLDLLEPEQALALLAAWSGQYPEDLPIEARKIT